MSETRFDVLLIDHDGVLADNRLPDKDGQPADLQVTPWCEAHTLNIVLAQDEIAQELGVLELGGMDLKTCYENFVATGRISSESGLLEWFKQRKLYEDPRYAELLPEPDILATSIVERKHLLYSDYMRYGAPAVAGSLEFVNEFNDAQPGHVVIVSNAQPGDIKAFLRTNGIREEMVPDHQIIGRVKGKAPKPAHTPFLDGMSSINYINTRDKRVIGLDDGPQNMSPLLELGCFAAAITTEYPSAYFNSLNPRPDLIVNNFGQLRAEVFN